MKKLLSLIVAAVLVLSLAACGSTDESSADSTDNTTTAEAESTESGATVKAGFICLHDEQSTYGLNFINAAKEACEKLGIEYVIKTGIDESEECLTAAEELIEDEGCNYIFADSFGHEPYILQAAQQYPEVEFCHATGTHAHDAGVANFHNAFAAIYEGRYLAGVAAGMKLNEMVEAGKISADNIKVGYVGAYNYAEVISGYTSWFLGVRSVCPNVVMEVSYTSSWYDESAEYETAKALIAGGCVLISQHADSMGAPRACEEAGVPNVSYNGSTIAVGPNTFIVSSRINWVPYFEYSIGAMMAGKTFDADWTGTIATGSVELTEINETVAAAGTQAKLDEVKAAFAAGTLKVFDTSVFTYKGSALTTYLADVDDAGDYVGETEVVIDGYFHESEFRSAPYFNLIIDGITELGN